MNICCVIDILGWLRVWSVHTHNSVRAVVSARRPAGRVVSWLSNMDLEVPRVLIDEARGKGRW